MFAHDAVGHRVLLVFRRVHLHDRCLRKLSAGGVDVAFAQRGDAGV